MDPLLQTAAALIRRHEGCRLSAYLDTVGVWTRGWGETGPHVTEGSTCTQAEADAFLASRIALLIQELTRALNWFSGLDVPRQAVLVDMAYDLGVAGLMGFHHALWLIDAGDFDAAATAMLASDWAAQVRSRATEDAEIMRTGALGAREGA